MADPTDDVFFCDLTTMSETDRDRLIRNAEILYSGAELVRVLPEGYGIGYRDASPELLMRMADFVAFDRLCCAFLQHSITVEARGGVSWLDVSGSVGAKAVIREDFLRLLPPALRAQAE